VGVGVGLGVAAVSSFLQEATPRHSATSRLLQRSGVEKDFIMGVRRGGQEIASGWVGCWLPELYFLAGTRSTVKELGASV